MAEIAQLANELQEIIAKLRTTLARKEMAFGALFVGLHQGNMIVLAEGMPTDKKIAMLQDMIDAANASIEHFRRAS